MPWPLTASRDEDGRLVLGGIRAETLATDYGTPLYVYDKATLRENARRFTHIFASVYPDSRIVYAGKACLSPGVVNVLAAEGLGLDVVSAGELHAGLAAGFAPAAITFHGNNKDAQELRYALDHEIGLIAIDNDHEITLLEQVTDNLPRQQPVVIRVNPGVEANTHHTMRTGALDSKFGFPIETGAASHAVRQILRVPGLSLKGYHTHVGSQIFDPALVEITLHRIMEFAKSIYDQFGIAPEIISPGGGFGVADDASGHDVSVEGWAGHAAETLRSLCESLGLPLPRLVVEPGRAMVGAAGVTLYRVGAIKRIEGVRTFVSVDGGMADNIRPALYGARYGAAIANRQGGPTMEIICVAGKYCESGDVLIEAIDLPTIESGDLLAMPMTGAYCLAMSSNYNFATRPAVVIVEDGVSQLVRRRETLDDLLATEILPPPQVPPLAGVP